MALSAPGVGSNLDINSIVSQLMLSEQQPLTKIARQEASFNAKLSAIGTLKSALSAFQTAVKGLSDPNKIQASKVSIGDSAIASVVGSAKATTGTYALEVSKLAQAQKLASAGQASTSTAIGTGIITFDFGSIDGGTLTNGIYSGATFTGNGSDAKTVTIDSSNNTLSGIRDAINKAGIGVTASIVNDGGTSPYRLVLSSNSTGASNSIKISVTGDGPLQTLLNHDPAGSQALAETVKAQNAEFKVDGIAISKNSNTVTDVIEGVTLNLAKTNVGSSTSINVTRDNAAVGIAVNQFVAAYNQINSTIKQLSAYDATNKKASVLTGDATVRSIQTQVRGLLNASVEGGAGMYSRLSDIGVTLQKDGTLAVDNSKLQKAIDSNFSGITNVLSAVGKTSDTLLGTLLGSTGPLNARTDGINASLKSLASQKERISDRLVDVERRYRAQFTALDVAIGSMNQTSSFLTQQLANLPTIE